VLTARSDQHGRPGPVAQNGLPGDSTRIASPDPRPDPAQRLRLPRSGRGSWSSSRRVRVLPRLASWVLSPVGAAWLVNGTDVSDRETSWPPSRCT